MSDRLKVGAGERQLLSARGDGIDSARIRRVVARKLGIPEDRMTAPCRTPAVVRARDIAIWLVWDFTTLLPKQIEVDFGNRAQGFVRAALERQRRRMAGDPVEAELMRTLSRYCRIMREDGR